MAPELTVIGGMASAARQRGGNGSCSTASLHTDGAVGVLLDQSVPVRPVVSQGCRPFGEPQTVTRAERNIVYELAGRPALDRLLEQVERLDDAERALAAEGAAHRSGHRRAPRASSAAATSSSAAWSARTGDRRGRHRRPTSRSARPCSSSSATPTAADEDLRRMMQGRSRRRRAGLHLQRPGQPPLRVAGPRCAQVIAETIGGGGVGGMFCAGELGPVGGRTSSTASRRRSPSSADRGGADGVAEPEADDRIGGISRPGWGVSRPVSVRCDPPPGRRLAFRRSIGATTSRRPTRVGENSVDRELERRGDQRDPRPRHGRPRAGELRAPGHGHGRWPRWPTCCGPGSCATTPPRPTGPTATASCCRPATPRSCSTPCSTSPGYGLTLDDLRQFRQWARATPGHPEVATHARRRGHHRTARPGVRQRVGMAIAEQSVRARFGREVVRPPDLGDLLRRRPVRGRQPRGRVAGRPPRARPPVHGLRRQPHLHRRADRAGADRRRRWRFAPTAGT